MTRAWQRPAQSDPPDKESSFIRILPGNISFLIRFCLKAERGPEAEMFLVCSSRRVTAAAALNARPQQLRRIQPRVQKHAVSVTQRLKHYFTSGQLTELKWTASCTEALKGFTRSVQSLQVTSRARFLYLPSFLTWEQVTQASQATSERRRPSSGSPASDPRLSSPEMPCVGRGPTLGGCSPTSGGCSPPLARASSLWCPGASGELLRHGDTVKTSE